MQTLQPFLPIDRCHALVTGVPLPDRCRGAALFADVSGFTALTGVLAAELGGKRGAEALLGYLNAVYERLVTVIHDQAGSVVGFAGDSITCWFDQRPGGRDLPASAEQRAVTAAFCLHQAMRTLPAVTTPAGTTVPLGIKIAVAAGPARRFAVGDPAQSRLDTLAGSTLTRMAAAERVAAVAETVVDAAVIAALGGGLELGERRSLGDVESVAVATRLTTPAAPAPWPERVEGLRPEEARNWVLPAVAERLGAGDGFLGELRPAVPLFIGFEGIAWDDDLDAGLLLDRYVRWAQGILGELGGAVIQLTIGDKGSNLYAAFGAPVAHEDDADRAAAAALALANPPPDLDYVTGIRIGMAQGQAWTGACGAAARRCFGVMGEPVNLAARLMVRAGPGEILADERLVRAARRHAFSALEAVTVQGRAAPAGVARLEGRRETAQPRGPTAARDLIGRRGELGRILSLLDAVRSGGHGTVLLEGEAGIGKSRLAAEVAARSRDLGLPTFQGTADAVERGRAYHAWRGVFAALLAGDSTEALLARLAALDPALAPRAPLLNAVLPLGLPETPLTARMDAAVRAENTRDLMVRLLLELTGGSLSLVLEDAHWFDSASWALLAALRRRRAPLFLLVVTRLLEEAGREAPLPVECAELVADTETLRLRLEALPADDAVTLACRRLGIAELPPRIARLIMDRAEGNPLFVEELAQAMVESGVLTIEGGRCTVTAASDEEAASAFPDTLEGLVTSRLDRLAPPAQRTAKVASVIGRIFPFETLEGVYPIAEERATIPHSLEELERIDITRHAAGGEPTYTFKHAITHEVVYGTLLFSQRQVLHRAVAEWYERRPGTDPAAHYPLLAHHWERAEAPAEAVRYGELAGEQALASYANREAAAFFTRVLARLDAPQTLPELPAAERRLRRSRALRRLGTATYSLGDMTAASARLEGALAALGRPWPATRLSVMGLLFRALARQAAHRLLFMGRAAPSPRQSAERTEMAAALGTLIRTYYPTGNLLGAITANFHALNLAERAGGGPEVAGDLATACTNVGAVLDNVLGLHRVAARYYERARKAAESAGHLSSLAYLEQVRGMIFTATRRLDQATAPFERAAALYAELGDSRGWEEVGFSNAGRALASGDLRGALGLMEGVVASSRRRDSPQALRLALAQQALVLLRLGRLEEAERAATESRNIPAREPDPAERIYATGVLALAHALQGGAAAVVPLLEEVADLTAEVGMSNIAVEGYVAASEAAVLLLDDPGAAWTPTERERLLRLAALVHRPIVRTARHVAGLYAAPAIRLAGALAALKGRAGTALRQWRWSLSRAAADGQHWDEAQAALALARFDPSPAERARLAGRARELFTSMGAVERLRRLDLLPSIP